MLTAFLRTSAGLNLHLEYERRALLVLLLCGLMYNLDCYYHLYQHK
jgi:hypothetical protein